MTGTPAPLLASTAIGAGRVSTGPTRSTTFTVKLAVPVLCAASVAEQVTDVVPSGNVAPEAGVQLTLKDVE